MYLDKLVPDEVVREFFAAHNNTSLLPQLRIAGTRLSKIFRMSPEEFEMYAAPIYAEVC